MPCACFPFILKGCGHFAKTVDKDLVVNVENLPSDLGDKRRELVTVIVAWYREQPWTDAELAQRIENLKVPEYDTHAQRRRQQLPDLLKPKRSSKES